MKDRDLCDVQTIEIMKDQDLWYGSFKLSDCSSLVSILSSSLIDLARGELYWVFQTSYLIHNLLLTCIKRQPAGWASSMGIFRPKKQHVPVSPNTTLPPRSTPS